MTTYILLRDNRESGPLSLEELKNAGLRSTDLIWVEGQSACWRNPGEMSELRALLKKETSPLPHSTAHESRVSSHVFVEMPASEIKSPVPSPALPPQTPSLSDEESFTPKQSLEVKYAMSLDEIKAQYVKNLEERRRRPAFSFRIPPVVKQAGIYLGIFLLGAAVIWTVMRSSNAVAPAISEQKRLPGDLTTRPLDDQASENEAVDDAETLYPESYYEAEAKASTLPAALPRGISSPSAGKSRSRAEENGREDPATTPPVEERGIRVPANEVPEIRTVDPLDIRSQLSVKSNSYTVAALGGIRDLELTLTNDSEYLLDKVTVEIQFLNPNGQAVKSESVQFKSVRSNATQTIAVKKSGRGVKIRYQIVRIESREAGMDTAGR